MQRIKLVGLALVAVCAIGVTSVASAGASNFLASATGALTGKALQNQKFVFKAGEVVCTTIAVSGTVKTTKSETQVATVNYSGCKAFGLSASISAAEYEFNANGMVKLLSNFTITATLCLVRVLGASNQLLATVKYLDTMGAGMRLDFEVKGITSQGEGTGCGYASESNGTYTGNFDVGLKAGGTLSWDA